jgi:hypothetical protein
VSALVWRRPTAAELAEAFEAGILAVDAPAWLPPVPGDNGEQDPGCWALE